MILRNFSERWITSAESIRTSNICDHAQSDQHIHAMSFLTEEIHRVRGESCSVDAPIIVALSTLGEEERG